MPVYPSNKPRHLYTHTHQPQSTSKETCHTGKSLLIRIYAHSPYPRNKGNKPSLNKNHTISCTQLPLSRSSLNVTQCSPAHCLCPSVTPQAHRLFQMLGLCVFACLWAPMCKEGVCFQCLRVPGHDWVSAARGAGSSLRPCGDGRPGGACGARRAQGCERAHAWEKRMGGANTGSSARVFRANPHSAVP